MNTQLMNKMLELMEEHFNEGDYVEGSKMMKTLYDDKNDILVKKIAILETDIERRDLLIDLTQDERIMMKSRLKKQDEALEIQHKHIKELNEHRIEMEELQEKTTDLLCESDNNNVLLVKRLEKKEKDMIVAKEILQAMDIDRKRVIKKNIKLKNQNDCLVKLSNKLLNDSKFSQIIK